MNTDGLPKFDPSHLFTEQIVILYDGTLGQYGRISILYPTSMTGDPDFGGTRTPVFTGHINIVAMDHKGQQYSIPCQFPIPVQDAVAAAVQFATYAKKAVDEMQAEAFRRNLLNAGQKQ